MCLQQVEALRRDLRSRVPECDKVVFKDAPYKLRIQVRPLVSWPGQVQNKTEHGDLAVEDARRQCAASGGGSKVGIRFSTAWPRKPSASATWGRRLEGEDERETYQGL